MITREQARVIAEQFLRERGPRAGWDGVDQVLSSEEVEAVLSRALRSLPFADARWRGCWAASVRGEAGGMIYVSRDDGEVKFAGAVRGEPRAHSG